MEKKQLSATLLVGVGLLAAGVLIFISCFTVLFSYKKTDAVVTSCEMKVEYDDEGYRTVTYYISADYSANDESYTAYARMYDHYKAGDEIPLYYHRFTPGVYKFEYNIDRRLAAGLILGVIGAAIAAANIFGGFEIHFTSDG
ncbi:MAG: hypothetical protein ACI4J5_06125 [Oscillospiraceae bacterium]